MRELGILHISDLHFRSNMKSETISTIKDKSLSKDFLDELTFQNSANLFYYNANHLLRDDSIDVIACTGDFGIAKETNTCLHGLEYISKLAQKLNVKTRNVVIAPGNHDLNRRAPQGSELHEFINSCRKFRFSFVDRTDPICIIVNKVPIVAINTCLGGTEQSLHGLPDDFWNTIKKDLESLNNLIMEEKIKLPEEIKIKLQDMDIPAIGNTQFSRISESFNKSGNFYVFLAHHSLLPAPNIEVRPYSNLIDAGQFLYNLLEGDRKILFLHGHVHCDACLTVQSPILESSGFLAAVGGAGLHGLSNPSATHIHIKVDDDGNFLIAIVTFFIKQGSVFTRQHSFPIFDTTTDAIGAIISIDKLPINRKISFTEAANYLNSKPDSKFAESLLKLFKRRPILIDRLKYEPTKWEITRIN